MSAGKAKRREAGKKKPRRGAEQPGGEDLRLAPEARLAQATRARMMNVMKEYSKLQTKIEEARLVNRAKCILIQYLKLTEPQAHRYIEKQAMDQRLSKTEVAQNILKTYEQ